MKPLFLLLLAAFLLLARPGYSQEVVQVQPSIMVIPFTKQGEDIRTILEDDPDFGIAITTIQKAFDQRGFTTIDFRGVLKATITREGMTLDNQASLKQAIIQNAGSDIYVEARISLEQGSAGSSAAVQLNGIDSYTGGALSNEVCRNERPFRTDDVGRLAENALENCLDNFLQTMNAKLGDISANGRPVVVDIQFSPDSELDMYAEVNAYGDYLSDVLEDWFADNALHNNFRIKGVGDTNMLLDDVRIPLVEPGTGRNYRPTQFARDLRRYVIGELGIDCKTDVQGATIYLTIENRR